MRLKNAIKKKKKKQKIKLKGTNKTKKYTFISFKSKIF